ncbi:MAG: hypothetical protein V4702_02210 [Patescibacteria group bacterium]
MIRRKLSILLCLAILGVGLLWVPVRAQQETGGSGLQISPTKTDISIVAGDQRDFTIAVKNVTQGDLTVKTFINDFESDNITGNPRLLADTTKRTAYSLAEIIKGLNDFELKAQESKEIKLTAIVPANASPGAYFSAVRFTAIPKNQASEATQDGGQVALTASLAHLVLIEIPGEINEQIQLESLKFQSSGKGGSFFLSSPDKANLAIKNLGNGFSRPFGKVTISRFGKEVFAYDVNNTDPKAIVLPKSSRTLINDVKNIKSPGKYTAVASVAYGNGAEVINQEVSFWYVPAWLIALILAIILAVVIGSYLMYRKRFGKRQAKKNRR